MQTRSSSTAQSNGWKRMAAERLVAVTQRVVEVPSYGELRDSLDQEWSVWLTACGFTPVPVPNRLEDVAAFLARLDVVGAILTGGNNLTLDSYEVHEHVEDAYESRDVTERAVLDFCAENDLPAIGYCRGMQMLQAHGGGRLSRLDGGPVGHVAELHEVALLSESWRDLADATKIEVNSYHNYGFRAEDVGPEWEVTAITETDGIVEGFVHRSLPFLGVGWHPERENPSRDFDRRLILAWLGGTEVDWTAIGASDL